MAVDVAVVAAPADHKRLRALAAVLSKRTVSLEPFAAHNPKNALEAARAALEAPAAVIVVWTAASVGSDRVIAEARAAHIQDKLIQTIWEPCQAPLFFGMDRSIDLSGWNGDELESHIQEVLAECDRLIVRAAPSRDQAVLDISDLEAKQRRSRSSRRAFLIGTTILIGAGGAAAGGSTLGSIGAACSPRGQ